MLAATFYIYVVRCNKVCDNEQRTIHDDAKTHVVGHCEFFFVNAKHFTRHFKQRVKVQTGTLRYKFL